MKLDADANQWSLFGYDMRSIGQLWSGAWRDFLFSEQSPVRARFDEPVTLTSAGGAASTFLSGERKPDAEGVAPCAALAVPEDLYLARTLTLPAAAESELDAVLAMEMSANSPFGLEDTVSGWREVFRSEEKLTVILVVAARSALMHWVSSQHPDRDAAETELWAEHSGSYVVLQGFGEAKREALYKMRLGRAVGLIALTLVLLYTALGLFVLQQRIVLNQFDALQKQVVAASGEVSEKREQLLSANAAIEAGNELVSQYPNPHVEIARLTQLLADDAYLAHFSMRGLDLRIRGRSVDAAKVMQGLSAEPAFASVTAPQAITAVGNSGVEQFYLDVELDQGGEDASP